MRIVSFRIHSKTKVRLRQVTLRKLQVLQPWDFRVFKLICLHSSPLKFSGSGICVTHQFFCRLKTQKKLLASPPSSLFGPPPREVPARYRLCPQTASCRYSAYFLCYYQRCSTLTYLGPDISRLVTFKEPLSRVRVVRCWILQFALNNKWFDLQIWLA